MRLVRVPIAKVHDWNDDSGLLDTNMQTTNCFAFLLCCG